MVIFHWSLFDGKMVGIKRKTVNITHARMLYDDAAGIVLRYRFFQNSRNFPKRKFLKISQKRKFIKISRKGSNFPKKEISQNFFNFSQVSRSSLLKVPLDFSKKIFPKQPLSDARNVDSVRFTQTL